MLTIHTARCEIDNHADTCCLGKNFIPLAYTNRVCDVHAFTDQVDTVSNIPVVTGATAAALPNGETVIQVVHQGLYFGDQMPHSLINPNQIRANSIPFCDDPTDPNRKLGFEDPETGEHVSFGMHGPYCSIQTRTPSAEEIENCRHIVLTSEAEWNPSEDEFSTTTVTISAVRSISTYEHALTRISPVMCGPTFTQAPEDQVAISGVASRPRKCVVSATDLANRWMIGLSTAQKTLAGTTQLSVRTGEGPIYQRFKDTSIAHRFKLPHSTQTPYLRRNIPALAIRSLRCIPMLIAISYTSFHCLRVNLVT